MYFRILVFACFLVGCSLNQVTVEEQQKQVKTLAGMLSELNTTVDRDEAYHLAKNSISYSQQLAKEYDVVSSPWINNALVNFGIKERGLCYEWTEDLLKFLIRQNYQTLHLHPVGANVSYLNEHNALVVSAKGNPYHKGILLDAWRNSGKLFFIKVKEDSEYDWVVRRGLYGELK
jgi:hypothetical protein